VKVITSACECAENMDKIVTIGITPTFPSTGYGYICCDFDSISGAAYKVREFIEKPDLNNARSFLKQGNYFWNSGIFVFKASVIIDSFKRFLPRIYDKLIKWYDFIGTSKEQEILAEIYPSAPNISIDYGIMERSNDIYVIPANMGWNDIGSWDSLGCMFPPDENGNIVRSKNVGIDTKNCVIFSEKSLIATIGVEDMIIVDCPDALLVCPKSEAQRVKILVDKLKAENLEEYL
jgi:mannose-1-phosphate guanylyltransferase